jgi:DNA mismatch repair protein MSH4
VILALAEGRGHAQREVGLAALDLNSPILILCQLSDGIHYTDTLNKIHVLNPVKILVPDTILETNPLPKLIELIKETFHDINIIPVQRRYFNDKAGLEQISSLCSQKSLNIVQIISRKYYTLSAAAALLSFLKNVSLVAFGERCLKLDYQTKGGLMIDTATSEKLELLYSLCAESKASRNFSLFGILNKCETRIGQRHLRVNILEPSCDIEFIRNRQEQIKILNENADVLQELKENLQNFRNVESLLKICFVTPINDDQKAIQTNIQLALLLKNTFEAVKPLSEVIGKTVSDSFEDTRHLLSLRIFSDIVERINCVVQPNIHENRLARKYFQHLYAVRAETNDTIDFLRQVYSETIDKINTYINELSEQCLLPIRLIHSNNIGYHLQVGFRMKFKSFFFFF